MLLLRINIIWKAPCKDSKNINLESNLSSLVAMQIYHHYNATTQYPRIHCNELDVMMQCDSAKVNQTL